MQIEIKSTSYLLPENSSWDNLKKKNKLKFADYNNIFNKSRFDKTNDCEVYIFFLRDLFELYESKDLSFGKKKIKILISFLKKKISSEKEKEFIVASSSYYFNNTIIESKKKTEEILLEEFFLNELYKLSKKFRNIFILNMDKFFAIRGYNECFNERNFTLFRSRLSLLGVEILSKKILEIIESLERSNKKVLLLDCDNTLWGGVVGEDGIEKIQVGQDGVGYSFQHFQKAIKRIQKNGIILGLVSKNNEKDVINVFKSHKSMILKEKDISILKINWRSKVENIKEISKDLFLGIDSFVFWDDNPIEREKVKNGINGIDVIEPDDDVANWARQLLEYNGFSKTSITKEDRLKTNHYKKRSLFLEKKKESKNESEYLKKIKLKAKLENIKKDTIDRAEQLSQKTNQFNFSIKRYKASDLKKIQQKYNCSLVHLRDLYGDHGLVGLIITKPVSKSFLFVDTFLMSCRIMGRYLENWMLNKIKEQARRKKIKKIIFEFNQNKKNKALINNFIISNKLKKIEKREVYKFRDILKINRSSKFYQFKINQNIKNINLYKT